MGAFRIEIKASAEKDLSRLERPILVKVLEAVESLSDDPLPRQSTKLAGAERLYRLRVGRYRVVYELDRPAQTITVHHVRHRRDAYNRLPRRS